MFPSSGRFDGSFQTRWRSTTREFEYEQHSAAGFHRQKRGFRVWMCFIHREGYESDSKPEYRFQNEKKQDRKNRKWFPRRILAVLALVVVRELLPPRLVATI